MITKFQNCGINNIIDYGLWVNEPQNILIGSNVFIGRNVYINAYERIQIGNFCAIAADCKLISGNHGYSDIEIPINLQAYENKPIILHDDVWLGYNVIILPGVILGKGCIVGAGSVVTKSFPDYSVIAGTPAKLIKKRGDEI